LRQGLGMGLRHGLEYGLGLRDGLEAWGREGWPGLRHGGEAWLGLNNGKRCTRQGFNKSEKGFSKNLKVLSEARNFEILYMYIYIYI